MHVAGYIRVSTPTQKERGSHKRQEEDLRAWAEEHNYDITLFRDIAKSGGSANREEYNAMMRRLDEFDAIVVRELSRLGRRLETGQIVEQIEEQGTEFICLREDYDLDSAEGKLNKDVKVAFNRYKIEKGREEALKEIKRRREKALPIGRPEKLSEEQKTFLFDLYQHSKDEGQRLSYGDLAVIAKRRFNVEKLSRKTVGKYMREMRGAHE